jgi:glycosyltransferase involved in cell wall biosynthesis
MVGAAFTAEMKALIAEKHLEDRVLGVEACSTEELAALYSAAGALLFPSLAEGFGWPVIEAQACGCPVICSDVQPFPEVAGEGAILLDPKDEQAFADRIRQLLSDPDARFGIITKGYANADRFGPEKMVSGYLERYAALATLSVSSGAEGVAGAASMCGSPSNSV